VLAGVLTVAVSVSIPVAIAGGGVDRRNGCTFGDSGNVRGLAVHDQLERSVRRGQVGFSVADELHGQKPRQTYE
jgi:hypothetical protein